MATNQLPRWERPGYGDITAARIIVDELEVAFADGDVVRVPLSAFEISTSSTTRVRVVDGLSVEISDRDQVVEISWMRVRSFADPNFAAHVRDLSSSEASRLGRRLRALREDRAIPQTQLAAEVGIRASQLARIETGADQPPASLVRALLRGLDANLAEIAGADALGVSVRTLVSRAARAGVPRALGSALVEAVPRRSAPNLFAQAFGWTKAALLAGVPEAPQLPVPVQFKALPGQRPANLSLVHLALSTARLAQSAFDVPPYEPIPDNPDVIRRDALDRTGKITLASLIDWTWNRGIAVLPLLGKGGFAAAVMQWDRAPIIIIKETRALAAFWLFDLAHELGHISRGHVKNSLVDIQPPTDPTMSDTDEHEATDFALELLLPNHAVLLEEVRADARGDGVRFKFAVERVADRAQVSRGILGIVAAFALIEVGRPLDRWGSATNLAKLEGPGREIALHAALRRAALERLSDIDAALIRSMVLSGE
jgi:transcriptional regulator with XRE-family HTH domain/Zn-dependent peptidase ImmA (M78 family)